MTRANVESFCGFGSSLSGAGFGQIHGQAPERLQHFGKAGRDAMQLFTGERSGIFQHAQIYFAMNEGSLGNGMNSRLSTTTKRQLFHRALAQLQGRLIPRQGGDPAHSRFLQ